MSKGVFIKLYGLHNDNTSVMAVYVRADNIRTIEPVTTGEYGYNVGIRSQIVFSDTHVIGVTAAVDEILHMIEET